MNLSQDSWFISLNRRLDFCVFVTLSFEKQDGIIKIIVGEEWEEVSIIKSSAIFVKR